MDESIFEYQVEHFYCDATKTRMGDTIALSPGDEIPLCLKSIDGEPVVVENLKAVALRNTLVPVTLPLIDDLGNPLDASTKLDCEGDICRVVGVAVPELFEYADSNGVLRDISPGVRMEGTVAFGFPQRRQLQSTSHQIESRFSVRLDLAKPPKRTGSRRSSSTGAAPSLLWAMLLIGVTLRITL